MSAVRSIKQIPETVTDPVAIRDHVNRILRELQEGGLLLGGVRLDFQRTTVPVDEPLNGQPTILGVFTGGVNEVYQWDGTTWVTL